MRPPALSAMSSNASRSSTPSLPTKAAAAPVSSAAQRGDDVVMSFGELGEPELGERLRRAGKSFEWRERRCELVDEHGRRRRDPRRQGGRAAPTDADRTARSAGALQAPRETSRARATRPAVPGCGRGPRSTAFSSVAIARALAVRAEPDERMLEQREQGHRRQRRRAPLPPPGGRSARLAYRVAHRRRNHRPRSSSARARRCTRRAKARSGVTSAAVLFGVSSASRSATAIARASSSAFAASTTDRFSSAASACAGKSEPASCCQRSVAAAGRSASDTKRSRPCVGGFAEDRDLVARDADAAQQRLHGKLRMSDRGGDELAVLGVASPADQLPRLRIEIGIEAGQHDRTLGKPSDGRDQLGSRRHRAGRAGGDHRSVGVRGEPRWLPRRSEDRAARPARSRPAAPAASAIRGARSGETAASAASTRRARRARARRAGPRTPDASSCRP